MINYVTPHKKLFAGFFAKTAHVFLSSGQSNCQGVAAASGTPISAGDLIGSVKTWRRNINGGDMYSGTGAWHGLEYDTNQYENRGQFGSILKFAMDLQSNLETADDEIYFIKADGNGKAIAGWAPAGNEYVAMVDGHIVPAMASLLGDSTIDRILVHDFFWDQGEQDAGSAAGGNEYYAALTALISNIRTLLGAPTMRFVIRKLGEQYTGTHGVLVKQAQEDAVTNINNVEILRGPYSYNADNVHLNASSQNTIGSERYALWAANSAGVEYIG
jgi:hypothetical protein